MLSPQTAVPPPAVVMPSAPGLLTVWPSGQPTVQGTVDRYTVGHPGPTANGLVRKVVRGIWRGDMQPEIRRSGVLYCSGGASSISTGGNNEIGGGNPPPGDNGNGAPPPERRVITMNPRYHDGLVAFKERCTDYQTIKDFLTRMFTDDLHGVSTFLRGKQGSIQVADIGCGDGTITSHYASCLLNLTDGDIVLDVIEPLEEYILGTTSRLSAFSAARLKVEFRRMRAEDYFSNLESGRSDLVLASHSLHLIPLEIVASVVSTISAGGYLVVVIGAKSSIMSILKDMFVPTPAITGDDIWRVITNNTAPRRVTPMKIANPSVLDLHDIELPEGKDALSETAKNILSLMIQRNIDDISQEEYVRVRGLILEKLVDGQLQLDNDCFIFKVA